MDYLTNIYNNISGNPIIMIILVAGLIVIGYAVVKKLFKLAIFLISCLIIYLGYIAFTEGTDAAIDAIDNAIPQEARDFLEQGMEAIDNTIPDEAKTLLEQGEDFLDQKLNPEE